MFHIVVVVHAVSHLCCVAFAFLFCSLCVLPMQLQLQHATCNMQLYLYPYLSVCTRQSSQQQPATQLCPKVPVLHCDDCAGHWHNLQQALQMPSVSAQASVAVARMCLVYPHTLTHTPATHTHIHTHVWLIIFVVWLISFIVSSVHQFSLLHVPLFNCFHIRKQQQQQQSHLQIAHTHTPSVTFIYTPA